MAKVAMRQHGLITHSQAVLAACLATGGIASHLTAALLSGLLLPEPTEIHIVGPRRRIDGVRSHQTSTLEAADRARLGAIELTSVARTFVDCALVVPAERLGPVVDDALRRRLVTLSALRACHERIDTGPGRRPTVALRAVLSSRQPGYQPGDSPPEAGLLQLFTDHGLPAPVLGHRVEVGRHRYRIDVSWPEAKLGLEYDSWEFHRTFTAFHRDRHRTRRLVAAGWTLLPVTSQTDLVELVGEVTSLFRFFWRGSTA